MLRFQQIDRYFHCANADLEASPSLIRKRKRHGPAEPSKLTSYEKIEAIAEVVRQAGRQYWIPGQYLAVDERIQPFHGRAKEVVRIPSKPTPQGYKIWCLADHGYLLDWLWHSRGDVGPVGLDSQWEKEVFSKTASVVLTLALCQPDRCRNRVIFTDNLFTTSALFSRFFDHTIGAVGTARALKTRTELVEEGLSLKKVEIAFQMGVQTVPENNNITSQVVSVYSYIHVSVATGIRPPRPLAHSNHLNINS